MSFCVSDFLLRNFLVIMLSGGPLTFQMCVVEFFDSSMASATSAFCLSESVETTSRVNRLIDYLGNNRLSKLVIDYRKIIDY